MEREREAKKRLNGYSKKRESENVKPMSCEIN